MAGPGSGGRPRQGAQPNPEVFRPVGLAGGIDTKTDYKLVKDPKTLQALNVRYGTTGSVRKRLGISQLGAITGAITAVSTHTELLACDSFNMYAVDVGTGALTTRGPLGPATLASGNILSIGTLPTQTLRTIQADYLTVGTVTYCLTVYEYGSFAPLSSSANQNGMDVGGTLYFVLSNAVTNAVIWTTSTQGLANSATNLPKLINSAGAVTFTTFGAVSGAMYPCITVYNGQFIVSWINASLNTTISDAGTSLSGCLYSVQSITFVPSATVPISNTTLTNATACTPFPAVIAGQPASASTAFSPALPVPIAFDIRTSGTDVVLVAQGQNYGAASGTTPQVYRTSGGLILYSNASTFAAPNTQVLSTSFLNNVASPVTLAVGVGVYAVVFAYYYSTVLIFPSYSGTPSMAVGASVNLQNNPSQNNTLNVPFSAVFTPSPTLPTGLTAYDGSQATLFSIAYSGGVSTASITAQSSYNPLIDSSNAAPVGVGGQLASRCFLINGAPAAWMIAGTISRSTLSSLVLTTLPTYLAVPPKLTPLAHAAYLRTFNPGVPTDPNTTVPTSPYPRQASNVSTSGPGGAPAILYASNTNAQENVVALKTLSFQQDVIGTQRQWVRAPQGILYLGAEPKYYDGNTCRTMGWEKIPEFGLGNGFVIASTALTSYTRSNYRSLGLCPGGTYTFFFVFVDYDAQGNVIYGSPSPAYQTTVSTTAGTYYLFIPQAMIPSRGYLQVYRNTPLNPLSYVKTQQFSQANVANYGTNLVGCVDDTGTGSTVNANSVSTEILSGGLLYAPPSGGELANDPPPGATLGVANKQRIFLSSQENPTYLYFSKPFYPGRAPEFNAGQFIDIDPTNGPNTGLAILDTTIVIFKKRHIYSFAGDGPDATGQGAFTPTVQIASDTGCQDPNSTLTTQDGVWFRSARGLQMLTRGGQVIYPAAEVENLLVGTTVISTAIIGAQNQLRFALANGNVLVYDYLIQAWSVCVYFRPGSAVTSAPTSLTILNGKVYTTNAAGDLCVEGTAFQDGSNNLPMTVQSAWINVAGPQGWGRIRRVSVLGDFRSAHTLSMSFSYDFSATAAYSVPYTASTAAQQSPYSWRVRAPRQVCQSVQITLTDNAPAGEGAIITGLVFELGPKSQALRVPDTQSV